MLITGSAGSDTIDYSGLSESVTASLQADSKGEFTLNSIENITGTGYNDELTGDDNGNVLKGGIGNDKFWDNAGDDILEGGIGDDIFYAGTGSDTFDGGDNTDTLDFSILNLAVTANLSTESATYTGSVDTDVIKNIENLIGSDEVDTLRGNSSDNHLQGGESGDFLYGVIMMAP
ncbi:hypothetical protein NX722_08140 [Endozoicomonas gorgoniicola]|uniref:Calcium-binding protein n=1 Tax=Endozoicomonas gorgoniicola TaxID=1234144 RepID=A0ABT3MTC4_9GAMM|nr:hypothetical protein [Endozoicomonas gorgoniicola]MCW7552620.1 hypothetical protein [Endozoicomonas gorgoniicola]